MSEIKKCPKCGAEMEMEHDRNITLNEVVLSFLLKYPDYVTNLVKESGLHGKKTMHLDEFLALAKQFQKNFNIEGEKA